MRLRLWLLPVLALPLVGCFQSSTVLKVNGDGTGTIEQRTLVTDAAIDQLRAFTMLGGGNGRDIDPVSEAQARAMASAIGPGVTYVSSTPLKTDGAQGRESLYRFTDVTQLRLSAQPQLPGGASVRAQGMSSNGPPITFALAREEDGTVVLRILVPRPSVLPLGAPGQAGTGDAAGAPTMPSADQMAMAQQMLAGARLTVVVEPAGHVVRTSSPYVEGDRVTLIDVDVDQAMKDSTLLDKLRAATTLDEAKATISAIPGLKLNLDPEITIEFAPAK